MRLGLSDAEMSYLCRFLRFSDPKTSKMIRPHANILQLFVLAHVWACKFGHFSRKYFEDSERFLKFGCQMFKAKNTIKTLSRLTLRRKKTSVILWPFWTPSWIWALSSWNSAWRQRNSDFAVILLQNKFVTQISPKQMLERRNRMIFKIVFQSITNYLAHL